ncbi:hypothetical protein C8J57DRAFT_1289264 [Mycena rebaudengoi]|nr:hypothetical protein C8J57DRAFT_1289264 [Mycena rebaudengoi]
MPPPYILRKVFFIPLLASIVLGSFVICYGWWFGDIIQFLLLAFHYFLFGLFAYLLQTKPVQPRFAHSLPFSSCYLCVL